MSIKKNWGKIRKLGQEKEWMMTHHEAWLNLQLTPNANHVKMKEN